MYLKRIRVEEDRGLRQSYSFFHVTKDVHAYEFEFPILNVQFIGKPSKQYLGHLLYRLLI